MRYALKLTDFAGYPPATNTGYAIRRTLRRLTGSPLLHSRSRAWVADVTGGTWAFVRPAVDYSTINVDAGQNADKNYWLIDGHEYEVSEPTSWSGVDRYRCRIEDGRMVKIDA